MPNFRNGIFRTSKTAIANSFITSFLVLVPGMLATMGAVLASQQPKEGKEKPASPVPIKPPMVKEAPQPDRDNATPSDRYGDPLPQGALLRLGNQRLRAGHVILAAFLPGGKKLLSVSRGRVWMQINVWEAATGKVLLRFGRQSNYSLWTAALSPDGKSVALAGMEWPAMKWTISFWDVSSGKERRVQFESANLYRTRTVAFAPDGRTLAARGEHDIIFFDVVTGKELHTLGAQKPLWDNLCFSPNGQMLAAIWYTGVKMQRSMGIWDPKTRLVMHTFPVPTESGYQTAMCFSPNGKLLVTAYEDKKTIHLWNPTTGKKIRGFPDAGRTQSLAFSPDGKLLASGDYRDDQNPEQGSRVHLWDVASGKEIRQFSGHLFGVPALAFSDDGKKLLSGGQPLLRLWDVVTGKELLPFAEPEGTIDKVIYSPKDRFLITGEGDGTLRFWERQTGKLVRLLKTEGREQVYQLVLATEKGPLIAGGRHSVHVLDLASGRETKRFPERKLTPAENDNSCSTACSPDGRKLALAKRDGTIRLLDAVTSRLERQIKVSPGYIRLLFSPDSRQLAVLNNAKGDGSAYTVQVWDMASAKEIHKWVVGQPFYPAIAFSADGKMLAGVQSRTRLADDCRLYLWNLENGKAEGFPLPPQMPPATLAFSPDGRMLALGNENGPIVLRERISGQVRRRLKGHHNSVLSLAFSHDGRELVSGSADATALIWDMGGSARKPARSLNAAEWKPLWMGLASTKAEDAFPAMVRLASSPRETIGFIRKNLLPAPEFDRARPIKLIAGLDDRRFAVRSKAERKLANMEELAEPALLQALRSKPSPEAGQRLQKLVDKIEGPITHPEKLRAVRAVEILERIGNAEARQALERLALGAPEAVLTREAKASLERLARLGPAMGK